MSWLRSSCCCAVPSPRGALVVAVRALALLSGHERPAPSGVAVPGSATVRGREQLADMLGVLRRPRTKSDRSSNVLRFIRVRSPALGTPDMPVIRLATSTPWGSKVFLVRMKPPPARYGTRLRTRLISETIWPVDIPGGSSCCFTAADIVAGRASINSETVSSDGGSESRYVEVVPDGVAKVGVYFPPQRVTPEVRQFPPRASARFPRSRVVNLRHGLRLLVTVHDSVIAYQSPSAAARTCARPSHPGSRRTGRNSAL